MRYGFLWYHADCQNINNVITTVQLKPIDKLVERCIHKRLYNYFISNDLITSYQSGFIKGDSTVNQLTFFYNEICQAFDGGKDGEGSVW